LWRIAVENLTYSEQHVWAALAGARVSSNNWRRAKAMLHSNAGTELRRRFLLTCLQRNRNPQLRIRALQEVANLSDVDAFDEAVEIVGTWSREERREGVKTLLQALAERQVGRRDQATAWLWRLAEYSREQHEEYAVERWPETKRLLGLLVNSSGGAHARNARRLVQAARKQDRRLAAALLAAALAHTPEAEEVLRAARTRLARKPSALARELLRNFPKGGRRRGGSRRRRGRGKGSAQKQQNQTDADQTDQTEPTTNGSSASSDSSGEADTQDTDGLSDTEPAQNDQHSTGSSNGSLDADSQPDADQADQ
jgi:hypothetical protein